jgi:hypothetical protein
MTASNDLVIGRRQVILLLQFLVGSLVTFGGTAFALSAVNSTGTALGLTHLSIGVTGLIVGVIAARRKTLPKRPLLAIGLITIAYSVSSVSVAAIESLLPTPSLHDALIGTTAAVIMNSIILYLLPRH